MAWLATYIPSHAMPRFDFRLRGKSLATGNVYDISQDSIGYIWFGTATGLVRYDGYRTESFPVPLSAGSAFSNEKVGNVYPISQQGMLWVKTASYRWRCLDLKTMRFVAYAGQKEMDKSFKKQFIDSRGGLWMFDTRNGLRHATAHNGKVTVDSVPLPTTHVINILEDGSRNVWAMTQHGAFIVSGKGVRTVFRDKTCIASNTVGGDVIILLPQNRIALYSPTGKKKWERTLNSDIPLLHTIRSQFVWRNKWVICSSSCHIIDIATARSAGKVAGLYDGMLLDKTDGYFFEANNSDTLWVFTPKGEIKTLLLDMRRSTTLDRNRKFTIRRSPRGIFYIASYGNGLYLWDEKNGDMRQFTAAAPLSPINSNYLSTAFVSNDGTLWLAQEMAGVSRVSVSNQTAVTWLLPEPSEKGYWNNFIRTITPVGNGSAALLSNMTGDAYVFADGTFTKKGSMASSAFAFLKDSRGSRWIALRKKGIVVDGVTYVKGSRDGHPMPTYDVVDMVEDRLGRVWMSTVDDGLIAAERGGDGSLHFTQYLKADINSARQHQLTLDANQRLWIATGNGIYTLDTRKRRVRQEDFEHYTPGNSPLNSYEVICVLVSSKVLWVGTDGGGLQRIDISGQWKTTATLNQRNGFPSNSVMSIATAQDGSLWVGTSDGLIHVSADSKKVSVKTSGFGDGRDVYVEGAALSMPSGKLLFGTMGGLAVVDPSQLPAPSVCDDADLPRATVTDLIVNGVSALDSASTVIMGNDVELSHSQNSLSVTFSTLKYVSQGNTLYQFYLEGIDKAWRQPVMYSQADYGNLPPGNYVLHVRAVVNGKVCPETTLRIRINQPWYNTWWAWLLWMSAVCLLAYYVFRNMRTRLRLRQQIQVEKHVNAFRIEFFTHIAHEFRTPLAIISHAVGELKGESDRQGAVTAQRGVRRLQRLVNQLLDFRRINTGNRRLKVREGDIVVLIRSIIQEFSDIAEQQHKTLAFTPFANHYKVAYDQDAVETIVYNLVSNAVKYTRQGDYIKVTLSHTSDILRLTVSDSGTGIDAERRKQLFKPFMQGLASQGGMGIGLYSSYSLAALHHGSLVYAPAEGHGSVFTFELPDDRYRYTEEETDLNAHDTADSNDEAAQQSLSMIRRMKGNALNDICVAIIEDDPDMMEQIDGEISVYFKTRRYMAGKEAMDGIRADRPALVLCDVMLPDTSGYDIVRSLKSDATTAYIPVILLTALDDEQHRLKSYDCGTDDYFTKPCNYRLLIGRMVQLVKQSLKAEKAEREKAANEAADTASTQTAAADNSTQRQNVLTSVYDRNFLVRLETVIGENLSNECLDVNILASLLHVGRTKLFERMKELTGMTPVKYIQEVRIKEAARLLREGDLNVTEVGYRIGMPNSSYFAQVFKARYGMPPSKYAKSIDK